MSEQITEQKRKRKVASAPDSPPPNPPLTTPSAPIDERNDPKKRKVTVELTEEEYKDLQELREHHNIDSDSEAIRTMAGTAPYRSLKKLMDPERKKKAVYGVQSVGFPSVFPCALSEMLEEKKQSYDDFVLDIINQIVKITGGKKPAKWIMEKRPIPEPSK